MPRNFEMIANKIYFWAYPKLRRWVGRNRRHSGVRFRSIAPNLHQAYNPSEIVLYFSERSRCRLYFWPGGIGHRLDFLKQRYQHPKCRVDVGDIVFDVGANIGEFSVALAASASKVYSFDPDPNCWPALNANAGLYDNIFPFCEGLGKEAKDADFYIASRTADSSFIQPQYYIEKISIPITSLKMKLRELSLSKVDFLKLEAEGFEPEILEGAEDVLPNFKKIAVDVSPERFGVSPREDVISILKNNGFDVWCTGNVVFAKHEDYL